MDNFVIHEFAAGEDAGLVNSHYFDTPDGVFLFDTQLLTDYADALLVEIEEKAPGRELAGVFITTPRPGHYLGSTVFSRRTNAPFYATKKTAELIAAKGPKQLAELRETFKGRLARTVVEPTEILGETRRIKWKGLTLELMDMGPALAESNLVCYIPEKKWLIAGELIYNRVHPNLAGGHIDRWLAALAKLNRFNIKKIYPGHGPSIGPDIIPHLERYLLHFREAINYLGGTKAFLDPDDFAGIVMAMRDKYPDHKMVSNLEAGIQSEFGRQRRRAA
jgi:glyoxylase-like metal-dependent hydrolase (beta-lactamase superfamily II)